MAYKPVFDISTLHYANKAVAWLAGDNEQMSILRLLRYVKQFAIWNHENEGQLHLHLNRIIAKASGLTEEVNGQFRLSNELRKEDENPEQIIQLMFGLLCLASVVEAIILGEEIYYIPGTSSFGFPLEDLAPYLYAADKKHGAVWKTVPPDKHGIYATWVTTGPLSKDLRTEESRSVGRLAVESLSAPFVDLGGHLYDTSAGQMTPVAMDSQPPVYYPVLGTPDLEKLVPKTPLNWTQQRLNCLGRMISYLVNGVCYQEISFLLNLDYVANPFRAAYLYGLHNGSGPSDRETMLKAIHAAVGCTPEDATKSGSHQSGLQHEAIDSSYMLFALAVANSKVTDDLLPNAYRLRKDLKPLRTYIEKHGWDGRFDEKMRDLVLRLQQKKKFVAATETRWLISTPLPTQKLAWLYTPHYISRPWLNSVRVVADQYRAIASLSERIEKMTERSLEKEALRKHWLTRPF